MKTTVKITQWTCDYCGEVAFSYRELPDGWVVRHRSPRPDLDEFFGRTEHLCNLCFRITRKQPLTSDR